MTLATSSPAALPFGLTTGVPVRPQPVELPSPGALVFCPDQQITVLAGTGKPFIAPRRHDAPDELPRVADEDILGRLVTVIRSIAW